MQTTVTSPFRYAQENEVPWIVWQKRSSLSGLLGEKHTDSRLVSKEEENMICAQETINPVSKAPIIQRKQYNAVLSRMNQALGKSGSFSAWQP